MFYHKLQNTGLNSRTEPSVLVTSDTLVANTVHSVQYNFCGVELFKLHAFCIKNES